MLKLNMGNTQVWCQRNKYEGVREGYVQHTWLSLEKFPSWQNFCSERLHVTRHYPMMEHSSSEQLILALISPVCWSGRTQVSCREQFSSVNADPEGSSVCAQIMLVCPLDITVIPLSRAQGSLLCYFFSVLKELKLYCQQISSKYFRLK